jgi:uncharacterized protein (DUF885 family)
MHKRLMFLLYLVLLGACGAGAPGPTGTELIGDHPAAIQAESARLDVWFAARWEEELDFSPMTRTRRGSKDGYDLIDDFSEAGLDERLEWRRRTVAQLRERFDYEQLTEEAQTSYDLWVHALAVAEAVQPFRRHDYVFRQMQGGQASLPQFLINDHRVASAADMEAYVTRIAGIARALDQLRERAQAAAAAGIRAPRFTYDGVLQQARAVVAGAPFGADAPSAARTDSPLWADAQAKIAALSDAGLIDGPRAETLRGAARQALLDALGPAYRALIDWLEADRAFASEPAQGVWALPDGARYYAHRLAMMTTTDMSADALHELGLAEVARLRAGMEAIKQRVGFAGTLPEFFAFLRSDERFFFADTPAGREAYLKASREFIDAMRGRLPEFFGILPQANLEVRRVEAFREQPGAAQHYQPGTIDGSRPGIYYVHLSDMRAMPKPEMEAIAYHEGLPGHHLQVSIAQERTGIPEFRTQVGHTAYLEGWALYAEFLAKEMGGYADPYSDFGRLSSQMWRAIRLVVDTGLHDRRWTREQAEQYFRDNSPIAGGQIEAEVRRYIEWPGQATAYKVGMLKILELRSRASVALGERFDIRDFHDVILGGGGLPLSLLEQRVDRWIDSHEDAPRAASL